MLNKLFFLIIGLLTFESVANIEHKKETITVNGRKIDVITSDLPILSRLRPLLVIAPAKKYLMHERLFEKIATAAAEQGIFVVRFNWAFSKKGEEPSKDLKEESKDLEAIIKKYSELPYIEKRKIIVAGKSFGTKVIMQGAYRHAKALLLLTPNCDRKEPFEQTYFPALGANTFTLINVTISVDDPTCDVNQIYLAAGKIDKARLTLHTLFGDHNFVLQDNFDNQDTAIVSVVNWLKAVAFK